jgi:hypothetical protein
MKKKLKKTRNITLFLAMAMVILYTLANCVFGFIGMQYSTVFYFDATQTSEWFEFWKWVVITGGGITVAKTFMGTDYSSSTGSEEEDELVN